VIPSHRPQDIGVAVARIGELHDQIGEEFEEGHAEHVDEAVHVMLDVARWLPEIAADSVLEEEDWNVVKADCESLGHTFDEVHHAIHDEEEIDYAETTADVPKIIQRLQKMVDSGVWNKKLIPDRPDHDSDVADADVGAVAADGGSE